MYNSKYDNLPFINTVCLVNHKCPKSLIVDISFSYSSPFLAG